MTIEDIRSTYRVRPGYWFVPKLYGMGATPVTWQGWAILAAFLAVVFVLAGWITDDGTKIVAILATTAPFVIVVWLKTDGGWRWQWGRRR